MFRLVCMFLLCACTSPNNTSAAPDVVSTPFSVLSTLSSVVLGTPTPPSVTLFGFWPITVTRAPSATSVASDVFLSWSGVTLHSVSFTIQTSPTAYGADLYTNIIVNGAYWFQLAINGRDHWNWQGDCKPMSQDSRFNIGLAAYNNTGNPGDSAFWTNDLVIESPVPQNFTIPTTYTITAGADNRIHVLEEGMEITYRDIGNPYPLGNFSNIAAWAPPEGAVVVFDMAVLSDGANGGNCQSIASPFIPGGSPVSAAGIWSNIVIK